MSHRVLLLLTLLLASVAAADPASIVLTPDAPGEALRATAIWTDQPVPEKDAVHGAFRTAFDLAAVPSAADLRIFAASRYRLWINGTYVLRGPARFELQAAEYDRLDVARYLHAGRNEVAVLVHRDRPTGRIRHVVPGLAVDLDLGAGRHVTTGPTWRAVPETSFGQTGGQWSSLRDQRDGAAMADWMAVGFDDAAWPKAVATDCTATWPHLVPRRSALQREIDVPLTLPGNLPLTISPDQPVQVLTPRVTQAYPIVEFEAEAGTELSLTYNLPTNVAGKFGANGTDTWRCRSGRQTWMVDDTNALMGLTLTAKGGPVRLLGLRVVEVLYPFDIAGSFTSPDPLLNHLWSMMARGAQILSEDAYVDCAERERVEWMECSPPMAQTTRVAMTTPTAAGPLPSDPGLLKAVLWRTAQTQTAAGMVKAHTCSERWDKHAIMVDRSCDWVQLTREYLDHSGDLAFVREIWPAIARQLDAFLAKRTPRGLVKLEEWADWGNHYKYRVFEGTALNSFMYAAVHDGAALAEAVGDTAAAARFTTAAAELRRAMLTELWDAKAGTMGAGLYDLDPAKPEPRAGTYAGPSAGVGLCAATRHSAIYSLRWEVIDDARREQLYQWVWDHRDETLRTEGQVMIYYHLFEVLYAHDDPAADAWVLTALRTKWKSQVDSPRQVPGESLGANGAVHCYSMFPTYFLSSYVLGVRLDGPVGRKALRIDPRLGDLPSAEGTVVTELGLVPVSWTRVGAGLDFSLTIPAGATATVRLPATGTTIVVDGQPVTASGLSNGRPLITLGAGSHRGTVR